MVGDKDQLLRIHKHSEFLGFLSLFLEYLSSMDGRNRGDQWHRNLGLIWKVIYPISRLWVREIPFSYRKTALQLSSGDFTDTEFQEYRLYKILNQEPFNRVVFPYTDSKLMVEDFLYILNCIDTTLDSVHTRGYSDNNGTRTSLQKTLQSAYGNLYNCLVSDGIDLSQLDFDMPEHYKQFPNEYSQKLTS